MVVIPSGRPEKQRQLLRYSGIGGHLSIGIHNNSLSNLRRGLMERVFYVEGPNGLQDAPKPTVGAFNTLSKFRDLYTKNSWRHTPVTNEEFLMNYSGRKLTIYREAVDSLSRQPLSSLDAKLKTFVKAEKLNLTKKIDPAPRVIQPRSARYNVCLGRYLRHYEHHAFKTIAKCFGEVTVFKGFTLEQQGEIMHKKWKRFENPVAVGLDASRFDQHVSVDALKFEHEFYLRDYPNDKQLKRLLKMQLENVGMGFASDGIIKYKKEGCRMSGDMNTSLGNCILMCAMVYGLKETLGIKLSLANNGDDCVIVCEKADLLRLTSSIEPYFKQFGFKMEVEAPVDIFERIEFCQTQPVFDGTQYIMVRKPSVVTSKDVTSLIPCQTISQYKEWLQAVGECGMSINGGIPVMQNFYQMLQTGVERTKFTKTGEFQTNGLGYHSRKMSRVARAPSPETRLSFYLAFGITPDLQESLEVFYDTHKLELDEVFPADTHQVSGEHLINGLPT
nr:RNA polymerase [Flumine tombus-like virus 16]